MKRIHYIVHGRVQGVGFRYYTRSTAVNLGLTGWVKNLADGTVEAEAQGDAGALELFYEKIGQGPVLSRVTRIVSEETSPVAGESSFEVTY